MKNENGYALLTVLLTTLVIVSIGAVLISSTISGSMQLSNTEKRYQAIDLAELGLAHYENVIRSLPENANYCEALEGLRLEKNIDEHYSYTVERKSPVNCDTPNEYSYKIVSTGKANGKTYTMQGDVHLISQSPAPNPEEIVFSNIDLDRICTAKDTQYIELMKGLGFTIELNPKDIEYISTNQNIVACSIVGSGPNDSITIDGNALIKDFNMGNKARITINGNAYFRYVNLYDNPPGNNVQININGKAFFYDLDMKNNGIITGDLYFNDFKVKSATVNGNVYGKNLEVENDLEINGNVCYEALDEKNNGTKFTYNRRLTGECPSIIQDIPLDNNGSNRWDFNLDILYSGE